MEFHDNGATKLTGFCKDGVPDGQWQQFDPAGGDVRLTGFREGAIVAGRFELDLLVAQVRGGLKDGALDGELVFTIGSEVSCEGQVEAGEPVGKWTCATKARSHTISDGVIDEISDYVIVDARVRSEFEKWHAEGAVNLTNDFISPIPTEAIEKLMARGRPLLVYGDGSAGESESGFDLARMLAGRSAHTSYVVGGASTLRAAFDDENKDALAVLKSKKSLAKVKLLFAPPPSVRAMGLPDAPFRQELVGLALAGATQGGALQGAVEFSIGGKVFCTGSMYGGRVASDWNCAASRPAKRVSPDAPPLQFDGPIAPAAAVEDLRRCGGIPPTGVF